jgi:cyanophycinase
VGVSVALIAGEARAEDVSNVKGALLFAGGNLRFSNAPVWNRFLELAGGKDAPVVILPTAAKDPQESGRATVESLTKRYGARAEIVPIAPMLEGADYRAAARDPANVRKLRQAKGIWFIGGEQRRITQALLNPDGSRTPALEAIWDAYRNGAVIGGSSAGTAIISRVMFADAMNSLDTIKHGITPGKHVAAGLGFIGDDWFVDQHFLTRGRFARALNAMRDFRFRYGIGVDEDTAVVFRGGRFDVVGYKGALVLDISAARSNRGLVPFNMEGARLTYLETGDSMDAKTREVTPSGMKAGRKVEWKGRNFEPSYDRPEDFYFPDMLGPWAIYEAMSHALDSRPGVVQGIAFAQPAGGDRNDLGFVFKVYRGADTVGWYTAAGGNESYTVVNVSVDITPVKLANPLYTPLTKDPTLPGVPRRPCPPW